MSSFLLKLLLIVICKCYRTRFHFYQPKDLIGKTQKCTAATRRCTWLISLTADTRAYHKACFLCHHCRNTLKLSSCCSFEGVLYCRPHCYQLFKRTGSLDKSFEGTPTVLKPEKPITSEKAKTVSSLFGGSPDKCVGCNKTVYPIEKVTINGTPCHKSCFKCTHGGCAISPCNYMAHEGMLYCKRHHSQLFKEKGNYSQLEGVNRTTWLTENVPALESAAES